MVQLIALDTLTLWAIPSNVLGQEGYALDVRSHPTVNAQVSEVRIWFDSGPARSPRGDSQPEVAGDLREFVGGLGGEVCSGSKCPGLVDD